MKLGEQAEQRILAALKKAPGRTERTAELLRAAGLKHDHGRVVLSRMVERGDIQRPIRGRYCLPGYAQRFQ